MILEIANLQVRKDQQAAFQAAFSVAQGIIASMPGYIDHELQKCIEQANGYVLLVRWRSLEDHQPGFRESPQYQDWRNMLHHFYEASPAVLHYERVDG